MANRRTIGAVIFDASTLAPNEGSPLRRKSMAVVFSPDPATEVAANNDEREKLDRRRRSRVSDSPSGSDNSSRRQSVGPNGLSGNALAEHYQQCIRLCAEGKITSKNVFSLSVIDYIGVLNKNDKTTNNMQTAQATLDISTKIYGLRVDCVYAEVLRMAGNPAKQSKNQDELDAPDPDASGNEDAAKKKRQRKAQQILVSSESLTGTAETQNYRSTTKNSESQTSDMLLQVTYPVLVRSGQSLYLHEDVSLEFPEDAPENNVHCPEFEIEALEDFSNRDICRPLLEDWRILGWSETDVPYSPPPPSSPMNEGLRFNLDASIHPEEQIDFAFDGDDETHENVDRCVRRPEQVEHIVDFEQCIMDSRKENSNAMEYSYVPKPDANMHWAGPDHWKPGGFAKLSGRSIQVGACGQKKGRKKKVFAPIEFSEELEDDVVVTLRKKIRNLRDKTVKHDWPEANTVLPEDVHIENDHYLSFYYEKFRKSRVFSRPREEEDHDATVIEDVGYDYDNDNDQEYCSQSQNLELENLENGDPQPTDENVDPEPATQAFTGENLVVAPKATQQIQIQYATRAKKVNMKELKEGMWKSLSFPEDREDGGERKFSQTYKKLEIDLGKEKSKALSIGLAFASLLHLANEKNLSIKSTHDLTDLKITQNHD